MLSLNENIAKSFTGATFLTHTVCMYSVSGKKRPKYFV